MEIIRFINENVDPFLMQLVVVPAIAIGVGVFVAVKTRLYLIAPFITFFLSCIYTIFFLNILDITSWEMIFPIISLIISLLFRASKKLEKEIYNK